MKGGAILDARRVVILTAVGLSITLTATQARAEVDREMLNKVVAAFVLNFLRYAEWPDERFTSEEDPIRIVVVGESPVLPHLKAIAEEETVGDRPLQVDAASPPPSPDPSEEELRKYEEAVRGTHLAFLSESAAQRGEGVRRPLQGALTVSLARGFVDDGGMIELYVKDNRVVFDVNQAAMDAAGVRMSSKVLRLAQRVKE